jgi:uncharacterized protein YndB with AHSA1/START domain
MFGGLFMVKVERSITIAASIQDVWQLLATQEGMRLWLDPEIEIEMVIGGSHRHVNKEANQLITGKVLEIIPEKLLSLSWFEEGTDWIFPTKLTFTLEETAEGTCVRSCHEGFEQIGKANWESTYQAYERGTDRHRLLAHLKEVAEAKNVSGR